MNESSAGKPWAMSVKAVIADAEGRQLLLLRPSGSRNFPNSWEWPGGKLDPGETFADGLAREVREECGLEVEFTGLAGSSEFEMPKVRMVLLCMHARITGGKLRLSTEHVDSAWLTPQEVSTRNIIGPMKPVLETIMARL